MAKVNIETVEAIITKVMDKHADIMDSMINKVMDKMTTTMNSVMLEITKTITDTFSAKLSALESKLLAVEEQYTNSRKAVPSGDSGLTTLAEVITKTMMDMEKRREDLRAKSVNVIVTGLAPETGILDKTMFEQFCEQNLTVKPRVVRTHRLHTHASVNKMRVTLENSDSVSDLIESAQLLKQSPQYSRVFISRDLTKEQAEEAYKARCAKRNNRGAGNGQPSQPLVSQPFQYEAS